MVYVRYMGQPANSLIADPSLESFLKHQSAFLPWLHLPSQFQRLGFARLSPPRPVEVGAGVQREERNSLRAEPCWPHCPGPGPCLGRLTDYSPFWTPFPYQSPECKSPLSSLCHAGFSNLWLPALSPGAAGLWLLCVVQEPGSSSPTFGLFPPFTT